MGCHLVWAPAALLFFAAAAQAALPTTNTWTMALAETSCKLPKGLGTFADVRSGNQNIVGGKDMGTLESSKVSRSLVFKYKYVVGYCSKKGAGTGPTLSVKVGSKQVWSRQLKLATEDYPYDKACGGSPANYSPVQSSTITIPAGVSGKVHLTMKATDRNIHVVGLGLACSPAGTAAPSLDKISAMHAQPKLGSNVVIHKIHTEETSGQITVTFDMTGKSSVKGTKAQDARCAQQILKDEDTTAVYKWCPAVGRCTKSHCPKGEWKSVWKCDLTIAKTCYHAKREYHGQEFRAKDITACLELCQARHSWGCEYLARTYTCFPEYNKKSPCVVEAIENDDPEVKDRRYAGVCYQAAKYADGKTIKVE